MDRHQGLQCNDCISSFFSHRIRSSFDPSRRDVFVFMTFHALPMLSKKIVLAKGRDPTVSNRRHFEISIVRLARYRYEPPPIRGRSPANRPPSPPHPSSPLHPRWCIFPRLEGSPVPHPCSLPPREGASAAYGVHLPRGGGARMARAHRPSRAFATLGTWTCAASTLASRRLGHETDARNPLRTEAHLHATRELRGPGPWSRGRHA